MNELLVVQLHLTLALRSSRMECSVPVCQCCGFEPASLAAAARKVAHDGGGLHPPAKLGPLYLLPTESPRSCSSEAVARSENQLHAYWRFKTKLRDISC